MTDIATGRVVTNGESHRGDSRTPVREPDDCLPPGALQRAVLLVGAVHDEGPREVEQVLRRLSLHELRALAVTLAAMVPVDQTPRELLAWNDEPTGGEQPQIAVAPGQAPLFSTAEVAAPDLLAATGPKLKPCGTRTAAERHIANGEPLDPACKRARREYYADHGRKRREREREKRQGNDEGVA